MDIYQSRKKEDINIANVECKLLQYAEDTAMILDGSEISLSRTLLLLDNFAISSGLKINYEKTAALWIGSYKDRDFSIPSSKPITWARGKVYALGVLFSTSEINESSINFREKIEKMKKIMSSWSARNLTLLGKIAILKSLVVSQIVYLLSSLPSPPGVIKEINCLLYDFLWDSKGDKIKRTEMINEYNKGGLKMIDLQSFNESLKIKWIKGYLDDNNKGKWKSFVNNYLEKHGGKLVFSANLKRQDTPLLNISDPFLAETVEYWSTLNYSEDNLNFPSSQIWLNSLIRIDNKPFFYKSWFHAGVKDVKDLLDDSNYNFLSYTAFITKYNIKTNYLEYYKVVSALKHFRKKCSNNQNFTTLEKATDNLFSSEKVCKTIYPFLVKTKTSSPVKSQGKWLDEIFFQMYK